MIQDLEQIECRRGVLEPGMKSDDLPVRTWCGAKIPGEARKSTNEEDILNLGGVYGDKDAGNPIEYDHLRLVLSDDVVEVEFFNRGITLFMTEGEKVKRIHRRSFDERHHSYQGYVLRVDGTCGDQAGRVPDRGRPRRSREAPVPCRDGTERAVGAGR